MRTIAPKRPPIVRLPPKSNIEVLVTTSARVAVIVIAVAVVVVSLEQARLILEPVALAIVLGLMLGPVASMMERRGVPYSLSSAGVVFIFLMILSAFTLALLAPISFWVGKLPQMWAEVQHHLSQLKQPLDSLKNIRDQLRGATGSKLTVQVDQGSPVESMAVLAPAVIGQVLVFFATLYFFVATRHATRTAILRVCVTRRVRWRAAHIFRDVEHLVSRYLLSITIINIGQGCAVTLVLWALRVPDPAMWGALAGLLNFIVYIGPAAMVVILLGVGVASFNTVFQSLLPAAAFLMLHLTEAQLVTPTVLGRTLTLNPFIIFLALAFWIWLWGPVGGFIAVPTLLICYAIVSNILPGMHWADAEEPARPKSRR